VDRFRNTSGAGGSSKLATPGSGGTAVGHRSGLVIDVDYQSARAVMFGRVEGRGRFISGSTVPSTATPPIDDASVGARQSVRGIEDHTGLRIAGPEGIDIPSRAEHGVDVLAITGQPAIPVRLSIVALGETPMSAPMLAAARRTTTIVDVLADRVRTTDGTLSGALLETAIREFRPDALVLLQGNMAETEWAAAIGTLTGLVGEEIVNLIIIVAGDQYQQQAAQLIGERADLRGIDPVEFSVADIAAALETELQALYDARVDTQSLITATEQAPYVSRVRAADLVTRFVARRREQSVVAVDIADGAMIHWATPQLSDVHVRPDIDLAHNLRSIFNSDLASLAQWLPVAVSNEDLSHWILNRALRPNTVAETTQDMLIERAILVELLRTVWTGMSASLQSNIDLIIAGRPFSTMPEPALAVTALLDALQPDPDGGVVELVLDTDGLVPAAGALGERSPALAADVVEHDLIHPFATAIIVRGAGGDGQLAVRGEVRHENGETARFSVPHGSIHRIKIASSETANLSLTCEGDCTIGGHSQLADISAGRDGDLRAGHFGIVIDARGRPINQQLDPALRMTRVQNWFEDLGLKV
jgi:hypothetical protein